jgi:cytochrome c oxidase subunit 2
MKSPKRALAGGVALLLAAAPAYAAWDLNLRVGVTPLSRDIYGLHMLILWVCVAIAVAVFAVMIYSVATFRHSKGATPANFDHSTLAEVIWTIIPVLILVFMAIPAARTLVAIEDSSGSELTVKVTGYQWKWQYEYVEHGVSFFSTLARRHDVRASSTPASIRGRSTTTCSRSITRWSFRRASRSGCWSPRPTSSTRGGCRTSA